IVHMSEGLAMYLKPKGIGVTCLCPGPVYSDIMSSMRSFGPPTETLTPGKEFTDNVMQAEEVGEQVVDAIRRNRFMLPTHEAVWPLLARRAADWDGFLQERIDNPNSGTLS